MSRNFQFNVPAILQRKKEFEIKITPIGEGPEAIKKWRCERANIKAEIATLQAQRNGQIREAALAMYVADLTKLGVEEQKETLKKKLATKVTNAVSKVWADAFRNNK